MSSRSRPVKRYQLAACMRKDWRPCLGSERQHTSNSAPSPMACGSRLGLVRLHQHQGFVMSVNAGADEPLVLGGGLRG